MIRTFLLIIIILFEQLGIAGPVSVGPPTFDYDNTYNDNPYLAEIAPYPEKNSDKEINIPSRAYLVMDFESGKILAQKDADIRLPIASLTKIMTAIVVLENSNLDDVVKISDNAVATYGIGIALRPGEHLTVEQLLHAALLNSSNDSAVALAEHVSGTEEKFVEKMNEKAIKLGLHDTRFQNASGLDKNEQYASIYDLALLTKYALSNEIFVKIVSTKSMVITSKEGINHYLTNSNKLMGVYYNILGVKTGYTHEANQCLVNLAENEGKKILTIVLGSDDRFGETKKLLDWGFRNFNW